MVGSNIKEPKSEDVSSSSIPDKLYFRIGEVSKIVGVEPYVLRFWEREFLMLKPVKTRTNQRLYKRQDIELILEIKKLLYEKKFTIEGAKKFIAENMKKKSQPLQPELNFQEAELKEALSVVMGELEKIKTLLKGIET